MVDSLYRTRSSLSTSRDLSLGQEWRLPSDPLESPLAMSVLFPQSSFPQSRRSSHELISEVDRLRASAFRKCSDEQRSRLGQFPTPVEIARYMASLIGATGSPIRLLDAGAGVGSLTTAFIASILDRGFVPMEIEATAFEIE